MNSIQMVIYSKTGSYCAYIRQNVVMRTGEEKVTDVNNDTVTFFKKW